MFEMNGGVKEPGSAHRCWPIPWKQRHLSASRLFANEALFDRRADPSPTSSICILIGRDLLLYTVPLYILIRARYFFEGTPQQTGSKKFAELGCPERCCLRYADIFPLSSFFLSAEFMTLNGVLLAIRADLCKVARILYVLICSFRLSREREREREREVSFKVK